jgi:hypothetical protein
MTNLESFSDQDLQAELARRQEQRAKALQDERQRRFELLVRHRYALLEFIPHGRTSCSDEDPNNGLGRLNAGARCLRCALLEVDTGDCLSYDFSLELNFRRLEAEK